MLEKFRFEIPSYCRKKTAENFRGYFLLHPTELVMSLWFYYEAIPKQLGHKS